MLELIALAGLVIGGLAVAAVIGVVFLVAKIVFWAVLLPFRLLFKLIWLPVGLVAGGLSLAAGAAIVPIVLAIGAVVAVIAAVAAVLALLVPAVPFMLLALVIWAVVRKRPVAA